MLSMHKRWLLLKIGGQPKERVLSLVPGGSGLSFASCKDTVNN